MEETIKKLTFYIQGSASEQYKVVFTKNGNNITARCNCPASKARYLCKHRIALIEGNVSTLPSDDNNNDLKILSEWIADSDCAEPYLNFIRERDLLIKKGINLESRSIDTIPYRLAREALKYAFND